MKKMWGGRFSKKLDANALKFTQSIEVDKKLAECDIRGSLAHVRMLGKCRIIPEGDADKIAGGLKKLLGQLKQGTFRFGRSSEDIHSDIEAKLEKLIGKVAGKLHTGRSRNDQVSLDTRLYCKSAIGESVAKITSLEKAILRFARKNLGVIIPGFTHLQHAQPLLLSHQMLAYLEMLERDKGRLRDAYRRTNVLPLGAAALVGTSLPIDRKFVARQLEFADISANSVDAVSDRDFVVEILQGLSLLSMHLSRMAEDLILMASPEFGYIEISDAFATGSSIMPQKKNPDVLELVRGQTGKIYGDLFSVLVTLKGLPLSYSRDMQQDKKPLFESLETVFGMLDIFTRQFAHLEVKKEEIEKKLGDEFLLATDLAEYLVKKGVAFRAAHQAVGKLVKYCLANNRKISELELSRLKSFAPRFGSGVYELLTPGASVASKTSFGGTSPKLVGQQIKEWEERLK